jgi:amino acid efflux transporter
MSSVLGSGVLVLPGLAAQIAGPASLVAWIGLSLVSYPLAYTFASLSARKPESGGVYGFAKESLGPRMANAVGWLFILWFAAGAPVVTVIAASYLQYSIPVLTREAVYAIAAGIMLAAFIVNYRGIIVSARVQLVLITTIVGLLVTAVVASAPNIRLSSFTPAAPNGLIAIGTSAALIFWSYLGYENVSNVAEEFKNPKKDFHRSILYSVIIIGLLYTSVAIAAIGTQAYKAGGSIAPFAAMLSNALGTYGGLGTSILAIIIIFGTVNVYTAGMSRVLYATAKQGGLPRFLAKIHNRTGVPHMTLGLILSVSLATITLFYLLKTDLETELLIPSGAAILVYLIGSVSGVKLLKTKGAKRAYPWISLLVSIIMIPFVGWLIFIALAFAAIGYIYQRQTFQISENTSPAETRIG